MTSVTPGRLAGRVAVVSGAGSGFGLATARRFADEGAHVVLVDVAEPSEDARALLEEGSTFLRADVADEEAYANAIASAFEQHGRLDVVVNNAGVLGGGWIDEDDATEQLWRHLRINVGGVWNGCRAAIRTMTAGGGGVIVNTASAAALAPTPASPAYGLAKAAVVHLTRSLAAGHGTDGIRVNTVLPGPAPTSIFDDTGLQRSDLESAYVSNIPLGRLATTVDIANAMVYLASDEASFVTGAVLSVDGAFLPRMPPRRST